METALKYIKFSFTSRVICLSIIAILLPRQSVDAQALLNYNGVLHNSQNQPVTTGSNFIRVEFRLFDTNNVQDDTQPVWGEAVNVRVATDGSFTAILGQRGNSPLVVPVATLEEAFGNEQDLWLQVRPIVLFTEGENIGKPDLEGSKPFSPMQRIRYAPRAIRARSAFTATTASSVLNPNVRRPDIPAGSIMPFAGSSVRIPEGWLLCDGKAYHAAIVNGVPDEKFRALFEAIGYKWGQPYPVADQEEFLVPDLRGVFLRGVNHGRDAELDITERRGDPDFAIRTPHPQGDGESNQVGSFQHDLLLEHDHVNPNTPQHNRMFKNDRNDNTARDGLNEAGGSSQPSLWLSYPHRSTISGVTGVETQPENVSVHFIIKY